MNSFFKALSLCSLFFLGTNLNAQVTYNYTGSLQTYVVPAGITSLQIESYGASGGDTPVGFGFGGLGGYVIGEFSVTPGETLNIYVGSQGGTAGMAGYNGGGTGITSGGGGGASDVRQGGTALANRIIVAGGGGGAAYETAWSSGWGINNGTADGGSGGGLSGNQGLAWQSACLGGTGGTQVAGGTIGGILGIGGDGSSIHGDTGGGGGGYYGGGGGGDCGGYNGAGGGGSGYTTPSATNVSHSVGNNSGNGMVVITLLCTPLTTSVSSLVVCDGEQVTLSASGNGNITWDNGIIDNVAFTPTLGTTTYTATSDDINECTFSVDITVNDLPSVDAGIDIALCDLGFDTTLTASGTADTYSWDNGITDGVSFTPLLGSQSFIVTGEIIITGCTNTDTVDVVVNPLPNVDAGVDLSLCLGDDATLSGSGADTYTWDGGITNGVPYTPLLGTQTFIVTGEVAATGCSNTDTITVTVNPLPSFTLSATDEMISNDGTITLVITGGLAPYTFDWDNDGTGDNDDTQNLTGISSGSYTVVMTDANGCTATETINVGSQVGLDELNIDLSVYPNPTTGSITVSLDGTFKYEVFNAIGQIVAEGEAFEQETIDLSSFENGTYTLRTTTFDKTSVVKFVKK